MHDCNGKPIEKGDEVTMRFRVLETFPGADECNVTMEAIVPNETVAGEAHYVPTLCCCSRLTEKVE